MSVRQRCVCGCLLTITMCAGVFHSWVIFDNYHAFGWFHDPLKSPPIGLLFHHHPFSGCFLAVIMSVGDCVHEGEVVARFHLVCFVICSNAYQRTYQLRSAAGMSLSDHTPIHACFPMDRFSVQGHQTMISRIKSMACHKSSLSCTRSSWRCYFTSA